MSLSTFNTQPLDANQVNQRPELAFMKILNDELPVAGTTTGTMATGCVVGRGNTACEFNNCLKLGAGAPANTETLQISLGSVKSTVAAAGAYNSRIPVRVEVVGVGVTTKYLHLFDA